MKILKRKIIGILLCILSSLTYCYGQKINTKYFFQTLDCFISDSYFPADQFLNPGSRYNINTEKLKYCKLKWSDPNRINEYFYDINSNLIKETEYKHDKITSIYEYDQFGKILKETADNNYIKFIYPNNTERYVFYNEIINAKQIINNKDNCFIIEEYKNKKNTNDIFEYDDNAYLKKESIIKIENDKTDIVVYEYTITKKIQYYYHYEITYDKDKIVDVKYYDKNENIKKQIKVDYKDCNQIVVDYGNEKIILTDFDKHGNWQKRYRIINGIKEELNTRELEYY